MKQLRLWLLILLCALLPLRGAMAAAMLCPPAVGSASGVQLPPVMPAASGHGHEDHESAHAHHQAVAGASDAAHDHADPASAQDKCTMCAAFCSLTPAPLGHSIVMVPTDMAASPTPSLHAQPPSFVPGGLERPPRSI